MGTSPLPTSASHSDFNASTSLKFWCTVSPTCLIPPSPISSPSVGPTPIPSFSSSTTPTTQTLSSVTPVPSYSSSYFWSSPYSSSIITTSALLSSTPVTTYSLSAAPDSTTTIIFSTTVITSVNPPSSFPSPISTSTYTITSSFPGRAEATTYFVTSSSILSTQSAGSTVDRVVPPSPGAIAAIVLGIVGALAFAALWLFCARRSRSILARQAWVTTRDNRPRSLDEESSNANGLGRNTSSAHGAESTGFTGSLMEERYAGILAALHSTEGFGKGNEGGSTGGIYGSRHDTATDDGDDNGTRVSSPTLAVHASSPDDIPYVVSLSPPPLVSSSSYHPTPHPTPPPSSYHLASRRRSSPGPDVAAWPSGNSVAPSCNSHYTRSQTLGSGSRSGSVDALTRTWTGSEEPLLGTGKAPPEPSAVLSAPGSANLVYTSDSGDNRPGLGSAFGSPAASVYSPSGGHSTLQHDMSGSYGARSASGSGSYGYASSLDALRRVSSQGALSSVHSQGHGQSFKFGFSRGGSLSSGNMGMKAVSNRHSFGVPPTSFKAWKDRGSDVLDKEKLGKRPSLREKDRKQKRRSISSASTSGSVEENQGGASPVGGVRGLLERLRRAGHTPSPHSSTKDLPSPTSIGVDPELGVGGEATPPPIQIQAATPRRPRRFSFVLSNPDLHPPSPYSGVQEVAPLSDTSPRAILHDLPTADLQDRKPVPFGVGLQPGTPLAGRSVLAPAPSPAPTEESRLVEGLLHPRLQTQDCSGASLRDFEDYSRPIGGIVKNRLYSTTTFGTQDSEAKTPSRGTPENAMPIPDEEEHEDESLDLFAASIFRDVPRDSWIFEDLIPSATALQSPVGD